MKKPCGLHGLYKNIFSAVKVNNMKSCKRHRADIMDFYENILCVFTCILLFYNTIVYNCILEFKMAVKWAIIMDSDNNGY